MSLFPRFHNDLTPVFRALDEYAKNGTWPSLTQESQNLNARVRAWQPKFDVKETKDSYVLHGELPGIAQDAVSIEWTDGNTLTVSGKTEHRSRQSGGAPASGGADAAGSSSKAAAGASHEYHKATVEDADKSGSKAVTKTAPGEVANADEPRWWITERSSGEFYRSFSFPSRVDHEGVKAALKDGVLNITVPKALAPKAKKIEISN